MKEIIISEENSDQRLDKYLKRILPGCSTSFIYKMLRKKNITFNGKKADGSEKIKAGDTIKVFFSDETFEKFSSLNEADSYFEQLKEINRPIDIIYEDDDMIIINKPTGILSQKANASDVSLNEMALSYLINKGEITPASFKVYHPSVVNRLDRNTSGIVLFAKNLKASQSLSQALSDRSVKKIYHAIVIGHIMESKEIEGYLFKDEKSNTVKILKTAINDSKPIRTYYEPIKLLNNNLTLLSIHLITGRTHQIRAHLSSIGHPILGDPKYGNFTLNKRFKTKNQLLHAYSIEFEDKRKYIAKEPKEFNVYF